MVSLGVFVVLQRPQEKINWLFGLLSLSVAQWLFGYALVYCAKDPVKALNLARIAYVGVVFIPTFFLHFMHEFLHLRRRSLLYVAYAITLIFLYVIQLDAFMNGVYLYFWGYYPKAGPIYWVWLIYFYAAFGICDFEFTRAYFSIRRSAAATLRAKQLKYVLWANCAATISLMDYFPKFGWQVYPCAYLAAMGWLVLMAYAIVKFRLMDVQLVIRKTLIYSVVSAVLTATYFFVVTLATHLSSGMIGKASWISIAAAGVVVTLIFIPIFRKIQTLIDRLFFRFRIDREAKLMQLSAQIIQQEDTEQLTQFLVRTLEEALHPKRLGLYLQATDAGDFLEVSGHLPAPWNRTLPSDNVWTDHFRKDVQPLLRDPFHGTPDENSPVFVEMMRLDVQLAVPLVSRDDVLGFLLLGEKRSEESYDSEDLILLRIIANQATVAYERPKLLREVSGGFVHEVKTPLSKISLPAQLTLLEIEQVMNGNGSAEDLLPKIQRRMQYIIDQTFLAAHRVEALEQLGSMEEQKREPVQLSEVLRKGLQTLDEFIKQARVAVRIALPEELPAMMGDSKQLEIVFVNLLKNAVEALNDLPAGRPREIKIEAQAEGRQIAIRVMDTGPGIDREDREKIFHSHYTTKGPNGAGIGLFLCRQIVELHGGTIRAETGTEHGVCFHIGLPMTENKNAHDNL